MVLVVFVSVGCLVHFVSTYYSWLLLFSFQCTLRLCWLCPFFVSFFPVQNRWPSTVQSSAFLIRPNNTLSTLMSAIKITKHKILGKTQTRQMNANKNPLNAQYRCFRFDTNTKHWLKHHDSASNKHWDERRIKWSGIEWWPEEKGWPSSKVKETTWWVVHILMPCPAFADEFNTNTKH